MTRFWLIFQTAWSAEMDPSWRRKEHTVVLTYSPAETLRAFGESRLKYCIIFMIAYCSWDQLSDIKPCCDVATLGHLVNWILVSKRNKRSAGRAFFLETFYWIFLRKSGSPFWVCTKFGAIVPGHERKLKCEKQFLW